MRRMYSENQLKDVVNKAVESGEINLPYKIINLGTLEEEQTINKGSGNSGADLLINMWEDDSIYSSIILITLKNGNRGVSFYPSVIGQRIIFSSILLNKDGVPDTWFTIDIQHTTGQLSIAIVDAM